MFEYSKADRPPVMLAYKFRVGSEDVAEAIGVTALPTFVFYRNGEKLEHFSGTNLAQYQSVIGKMLYQYG